LTNSKIAISDKSLRFQRLAFQLLGIQLIVEHFVLINITFGCESWQSLKHNNKLMIKEKPTMDLRDVMSRNVEVVNASATLEDAAIKMKNLDVGMIPVCDGDRLQGILTDRDITIRATANGRNPKVTKVSDVMTTDIAYCLEDQEVEEAVSLMEARQIRRLPILNQDKRLVGIISLADIAVHVGDRDLSGETLEEISAPAEPKR